MESKSSCNVHTFCTRLPLLYPTHIFRRDLRITSCYHQNLPKKENRNVYLQSEVRNNHNEGPALSFFKLTLLTHSRQAFTYFTSFSWVWLLTWLVVGSPFSSERFLLDEGVSLSWLFHTKRKHMHHAEIKPIKKGQRKQQQYLPIIKRKHIRKQMN